MKAKYIKIGGLYRAKVAGKLTTVRVGGLTDNAFGQRLVYDVTNLATGRRTTFRSAAKFRREVKDVTPPKPRYSQNDPTGQRVARQSARLARRSPCLAGRLVPILARMEPCPTNSMSGS